MLVRNKVQVDMLDGGSVGKEISSAAAKRNNYIVQSPNKRLLGFSLIPVQIYCLSNPQKDNWWHEMLRSVGDAPVVYNPSDARRSVRQLEQMMHSKGCFGSRVDFDTLRLNNSRITIRYNIHASHRHRIVSVAFAAQTQSVDSLLRADSPQSLLKAGDYYDQEIIEEERNRIATLLLNNGYYTASPQLVHFYVDTTFADSLLSIDVQVHNPVVDRTAIPLEQYHIDSISIDSNAVKESVIRRALRFKKGDLFSSARMAASYNTLLNLHTFNYIDIITEESPASEPGNRLLNTRVRLRNNFQQKISVSLELSNASPMTRSSSNGGNFGLETVLNYQHKNLFGGAEALTVETNLLGELPKNIFKEKVSSFHDAFSTFETGVKATLNLPVFLIPYSNRIKPTRTLPHTLFSVSGSYQYRPYFERLSSGASFGYNWTPNRHNTHQLLPIEMTYVKIQNIDWEYVLSFANIFDSRIAYQFSDHLILDLRYDYVYNSQNFGSRDNFSYLHLSAEVAGNLLHALSYINNGKNEMGERMVFDVPYSQYVRFSAEAKKYFYHGRKSTLVLRSLIGVGLPYGNSVMMPYEKGFYGGGPTTIRAWQIRRLGPGGYMPIDEFDFDRVGDISIVANIEERFPIIGVFEGALFVDVGNVWTTRSDVGYSNGEFRFNTFAKQLAVGAGVALRVKISILTLRVDFALPTYDPSLATDRWRFKHWTFSNLVTNFGIDYPF